MESVLLAETRYGYPENRTDKLATKSSATTAAQRWMEELTMAEWRVYESDAQQCWGGNIMDYTACEVKRESKCEAVPTDGKSVNIMALVRETEVISFDLKSYANRINSFLFGVQPLNDEKRKEPECLMDDLETVKCNLLETARELNDLCVKLGM